MVVKNIQIRNFNGVDWDTLYPKTTADLVTTTTALQFISQAEKTKLAGIATGANNYSLPTATATVLGGVKSGANIVNTAGVLSVANATTAARGVVQLNNSLTSTATDQAATAAQAKILKDLVDARLERTTIRTAVDLNVLTGNGIYTLVFSEAPNKPTHNHGVLMVDSDVGTPIQLFIVDNVVEFYKRSYNNSTLTWGPWVTLKMTDTTYSAVTTTANGLMLAVDKVKLNGIATGANNYTHPDNHPASMITGLAPVATGGKYTDLTNLPTLGTASSKNTGNVSGTVPIIGSDGKLDASIMPSTTITDTFVVATQAAMLALAVQVGDVAVRTDLKKTFILRVAPATTLANWQELLTPTDVVTSVAGKTGVVVLNKGDVGLSNVVNVEQATKVEFNSHVGNTTIHVTAAERATWNEADKSTKYLDVRSTSELPLFYRSLGTRVHHEFKTSIAIGLTDSQTGGIYVALETHVGYTDKSGRSLYQLAYSANGTIFVRPASADDTVWMPWDRLASGSEFDSHTNDNVKHITAAERTAWNNKAGTAAVTTAANGLMIAADKVKLNGIAASANNYVLPTATTSVLGGVKNGANIANAAGVLSVAAASTTVKGVVQLTEGVASTSTTTASTPNSVKTVNDSLSTHIADNVKHITAAERTAWNNKAGTAAVSTTASGLMVAADKVKLNGIATGAQVNTVNSVAGKTGAVTLVKADVGLGSLIDYGVASSTDAITPTVNNKYMTPTRTHEAIISSKYTRKNYLLNSSRVTGTSIGTSTKNDDGTLTYVSPGTGTALYFSDVMANSGATYNNMVKDIPFGEMVTFSFDLEVVSGALNIPTLYFHPQMGYAAVETSDTIAIGKTVRCHIYRPFHANTSGNILLHLTLGVGTYKLGRFKIERGSNPTDWVPADEDAITSLNNHIADNVKHVTAAERTAWNDKAGKINPTFTDSITIGGAKLQWNATDGSLDFVFN